MSSWIPRPGEPPIPASPGAAPPELVRFPDAPEPSTAEVMGLSTLVPALGRIQIASIVCFLLGGGMAILGWRINGLDTYLRPYLVPAALLGCAGAVVLSFVYGQYLRTTRPGGSTGYTGTLTFFALAIIGGFLGLAPLASGDQDFTIAYYVMFALPAGLYCILRRSHLFLLMIIAGVVLGGIGKIEEDADLARVLFSAIFLLASYELMAIVIRIEAFAAALRDPWSDPTGYPTLAGVAGSAVRRLLTTTVLAGFLTITIFVLFTWRDSWYPAVFRTSLEFGTPMVLLPAILIAGGLALLGRRFLREYARDLPAMVAAARARRSGMRRARRSPPRIREVPRKRLPVRPPAPAGELAGGKGGTPVVPAVGAAGTSV